MEGLAEGNKWGPEGKEFCVGIKVEGHIGAEFINAFTAFLLLFVHFFS
jgi:hypothetical protein